jgi:hypothetical protein
VPALSLGEALDDHRANPLFSRLGTRTPAAPSDPDWFWDELQIETLPDEAEAAALLEPCIPADPFAP